MELLDLSPELLHIVLIYAALGRGIKRAVRLRLVCKPFALMLYPALFETHLMDNVPRHPLGTERWQLQNQHGAVEVWRKYLVYRCLGERDATVGRFVEIRQIAQAVCRETALDLKDVIEAMCLLALSHGMSMTDNKNSKKLGPIVIKETKPEANMGLNMLTVAAHLDLFPLAERLLAEGHSPTDHNYLFAPPIQVAAQTGNVAMLKLFREKLAYSHFEPWSVTGAAIRGDTDILKLALRDRISTGQDSSDSSDSIGGQKYGHIPHTLETGQGILLARRHTSQPEIYEYLTGALAPWPAAPQDAHSDLIKNAGLGNLSMVRYLLEQGVPVQKSGGVLRTPLAMACRGHHREVAELLLARGADPNFAAETFFPIYPLHEAATAGGSLALARTLLDHGANPDRPAAADGRYPALFWAFEREHEDMMRFLLERGASWDGIPAPQKGDNWVSRGEGWVGKTLAAVTYHLGYESMADILRGFGFQGPRPDPYRRAGGGPTWHKWAGARAMV
ncbi:hypothetical protein AAE478_010023 [Parahypoxylon ruwenzoriense]